jgi:hypothetical protein
MKKTRQVVMLPTEKASENQLGLYRKGDKNLTYNLTGAEARRLKYNGYSPYHLYILSDEKIKEGDWVLTPENKILKFGQVGTYLSKDKKIIATTDSSLTPNDTKHCKLDTNGECAYCNSKLPQISESFIKAYIKAYNEGTPITEVQVEYEMLNIDEIRERGKGFLSQDNSKLKLKEDGSITIHRAKMYTWDDVKKAMEAAYLMKYRNEELDYDHVRENL